MALSLLTFSWFVVNTSLPQNEIASNVLCFHISSKKHRSLLLDKQSALVVPKIGPTPICSNPFDIQNGPNFHS